MKTLRPLLAFIALLSVDTLADYVVDVQLPGTDAVVSVFVEKDGTAFKPFDGHVDVVDGTERGLGFRIRITNFVVRAEGVSLTIKAERAVLSGWQTIQIGPASIKTPIVTGSSADASLQKIVLNGWAPVGLFAGSVTGDQAARIRIREEDSHQPPRTPPR